jgi:hypothetical protein
MKITKTKTPTVLTFMWLPTIISGYGVTHAADELPGDNLHLSCLGTSTVIVSDLAPGSQLTQSVRFSFSRITIDGHPSFALEGVDTHERVTTTPQDTTSLRRDIRDNTDSHHSEFYVSTFMKLLNDIQQTQHINFESATGKLHYDQQTSMGKIVHTNIDAQCSEAKKSTGV